MFLANVNLKIMMNVRNTRTEEKWKEVILPRMIKQHCTPRVQAILNSPELKIPKIEVTSQYLYGNSHTGKTIQAYLILLEWSKQQYLADRTMEAMFVSASTLLNQLRSIINTNGDPTTVLAGITKTPFLILDDIGSSKTTDWVLEQLYLLVNTRYEYMLPTVFTSNYSLSSLAWDHLGDERISSRIEAMCKIIKKEKSW